MCTARSCAGPTGQPACHECGRSAAVSLATLDANGGSVERGLELRGAGDGDAERVAGGAADGVGETDGADDVGATAAGRPDDAHADSSAVSAQATRRRTRNLEHTTAPS